MRLLVNKYFLCYACCIPVQGHTRSILCDLQRGSFLFIPNVLAEILELCREHTVQEIHALYDHQHDEQIDEYFQYLIDQDCGFYTDEPQRFPAMSLDWRDPKVITNCLLDFDAESRHDLVDLNEQLSSLGCEALELRFFFPLEIEELAERLRPFRDSTLRSISVLTGYHPSLAEEALRELLIAQRRVRHITVHSSPVPDQFLRVDLQTTLQYTQEEIGSEACCGNVSSRYFSCNIGSFTEAMHFNNCLNKKIGIDKRGAIKNCPSMPHSYGDIRTTPLAEVVRNADFRKLWGVTKDQVLVCQDCEFRYICHDCRVYLQDTKEPLSKPAKCRYDPYEARWE
jgi:SPASM domain peptide maturase of grasp-with-spasm system